MTIIFHHFSICFSSQKVEKTDLFAFFFGRYTPSTFPPSVQSKDLQDELPIVLEAHRSYQTYQENQEFVGEGKESTHLANGP